MLELFSNRSLHTKQKSLKRQYRDRFSPLYLWDTFKRSQTAETVSLRQFLVRVSSCDSWIVFFSAIGTIHEITRINTKKSSTGSEFLTQSLPFGDFAFCAEP